MKRKIFTILLCLLTLVSALAETNYKVSYTSRLNVRKSPSAKGSLLGSLKKGEEITVISINNGWAKIEYGKSIGYVSAKYLQELPKQTIEEPQKVEEEEVLPEEIIPENYNFFLIWANSVIFRGVWRDVGTNRVLLWKLTESRGNQI